VAGGEDFHVYYAQRNYFRNGSYDANATTGDGARLSVNLDYNNGGSGPESITIRNLVDGDYYFSVIDRGAVDYGPDLSHSGATVTVLKPGQTTGEPDFRVDGSSPGTKWNVFKLTIAGGTVTAITAVDSYENATEPTGPTGVALSDTIILGSIINADGTRAIFTSVVLDPPVSPTPGAITFIDTVTGKQIGDTQVFADGGYATFNPTGTRAVIASYINDPGTVSTNDRMRISVYDAGTLDQIGETITLPGFYGDTPLFDSRGNRLALPVDTGDGTQLVLIDLNTGGQIGPGVSMPGYQSSNSSFALDDSRFMLFTDAVAGSQLATIDAATGNQIGDTVVLPGSALTFFNSDGSRLMAITAEYDPDSTHVVVVDTTTGKQVGTSIEVPGSYSATIDGVPSVTSNGRGFLITVTDGGTLDATTQLTVIDTRTGGLISTVTRPGVFSLTAVSADGTRAVLFGGQVSEAATASVSVYDTSAGLQVGDTFTVPGSAGGRAWTDDAETRFALVPTVVDDQRNYTTQVLAIDTATGLQIGQIVTLPRPDMLSLSPNGDHAIISTQDGMRVSHTAVFDTTTGRQSGSTIISSGPALPIGARFNATGTRAAVTEVQLDGTLYKSQVSVIDTTTGGRIGNPVGIPGYTAMPAQFTSDGTRVVVAEAVTNGVDPTTNTPSVQTFVAVIDADTGRQVGTTLTFSGTPYTPGSDAGLVQLTPDGKRAIVTTYNVQTSGLTQYVSISVIDTTTGRPIGDDRAHRKSSGVLAEIPHL